MKKLILTVGLPSCGKTTWALKQGHPVVNRDAIRIALHGQPYIQSAEDMVSAIEYYMVASLFFAGHDTVIVDSTHLRRKYIDRWGYGNWDLQTRVFDTSAEVCIKRAKTDGRPELIPIIERMSATEYDS